MKIYRQSSLKELMESLDPSQPVFVDTETSKLGSQIRLVQIFQEHWEQVLEFDTVDFSVTTIWLILQPNHLVGHNFTYDLGCFRKDMPEGTFVMPENWDDTFYASRIRFPSLNTGKGFSLDSVMAKVLGYDPYDRAGLNKKQLQMSFERLKIKGEYIEGPEGLKDLTEEQLLYGAIDVYYLPAVYHAVKTKFDRFVYQINILTINTIQSDKKGLPLDLDKLAELEDKDIKLIAELQKQLPQGFNTNSYLQVRKILGTVMSSDEEALAMIQFRPGGLEGIRLRTKMTNSKFPAALLKGINEGTIKVEINNFGKYKTIITTDDLPTSPKTLVYYTETSYVHSEKIILLANQINTTRKALKRLNFVERAEKAYVVGEDGVPRIQGTFSPHAINGRIQVDNENLSQYPRTMKSMWGHKPGNGRKLLYSDFAQVELRIICAALPEMNMYQSLKDGIDLHTFVGNNLNLSIHDLEHLPGGIDPRFIAKQCNFLLLYGGGASNFQRTVCKLGGVWFGDDVARKITTNWKDIFSDIKGWHLENNKSSTMMDKTVSGYPYKAGSVTDLNNIKVSGTGSEIFKLWLWYLHKYILTTIDDVYIVNRVHDSVILDVPDVPEIYEKIAKQVALCAQTAWFQIIKMAPLKDVPMPVDVAVGSNWNDLEYGINDYSFDLDGMYMYDKSLEEELNG